MGTGSAVEIHAAAGLGLVQGGHRRVADERISKRIATDLPELSRDDVETYTLQLLNCTFFTRIGNGFRFLHQSYLESLVSEPSQRVVARRPWHLGYASLHGHLRDDLPPVRRGGDREIPVGSVLQNGSVRAQANFLAMSFRRPAGGHGSASRKQLYQEPARNVRFLAGGGCPCCDGTPENVEQVAAAFASEANAIIKAMIRRIASNWLSTASSAELAILLRSITETEIDAPRRTRRSSDAPAHEFSARCRAALFAFRRAMMQGDELWTAAVGGSWSLGTLRHARRRLISSPQPRARRIRKFEMLTGLFSGSPPLLDLPARLTLTAGHACVHQLERGDPFLPVNRDSFGEESQRLPVDRRRS